MLSQGQVSGIDWAVVGLSGALFVFSVAGAVFVASANGSPARPVAAEFNYLWRARFCFQVLAALFALVQLLRLQVLWGPESVWVDGGWYPTALCRVYIALEYGLLEPALLLLALFACVYSLQLRNAPPPPALDLEVRTVPEDGPAPGPSSSRRGGFGPSSPVARHPNFNIVFFSLGFTLPCCTAQLVAALFTRIFDLDYAGVEGFRVFFATYDTSPAPGYCPADAPKPSYCAWCVFPLLSTLISGGFATAFLMALWVVTGRIVAAAINRRLVARVRMLQVVITCSLAASLVCRGVTVLFHPFDLGFELLRLAHMVTSCMLVATLSYLLVLRPVRDARRADRALAKLPDAPPPIPGLVMVGGVYTFRGEGGLVGGGWGAQPPTSVGDPGGMPGYTGGSSGRAAPAGSYQGFGGGGFGSAQLVPLPANAGSGLGSGIGSVGLGAAGSKSGGSSVPPKGLTRSSSQGAGVAGHPTSIERASMHSQGSKVNGEGSVKGEPEREPLVAV